MRERRMKKRYFMTSSQRKIMHVYEEAKKLMMILPGKNDNF